MFITTKFTMNLNVIFVQQALIPRAPTHQSVKTVLLDQYQAKVFLVEKLLLLSFGSITLSFNINCFDCGFFLKYIIFVFLLVFIFFFS